MGLFKKTERGELGYELFRKKIDFWSFDPPEGCEDQYEAVMRRSFPNASRIDLLYREIAPDKTKSLLEWTILPVNTFKNLDHIKDGRHNYLVEEGEKQYLVQLSQDEIVATEVVKKVREKAFIIGGNRYEKLTTITL